MVHYSFFSTHISWLWAQRVCKKRIKALWIGSLVLHCKFQLLVLRNFFCIFFCSRKKWKSLLNGLWFRNPYYKGLKHSSLITVIWGPRVHCHFKMQISFLHSPSLSRSHFRSATCYQPPLPEKEEDITLLMQSCRSQNLAERQGGCRL